MLIAMYEHANSHVLIQLAAFACGLRRHNENVQFVPFRGSRVEVADLAVMWGHKRLDVIEAQQRRKRRYLVLERGYVGDRLQWTSAGFDGLNGRADFANEGKNSSRFDKHFMHLLSPWKESQGYVLIIGQCRRDVAVRGIDLERELERISEAIFAIQRERPFFRPHPQDMDHPTPKISKRLLGDLSTALSDARVVVTINSNVGVDAILRGVPVVALDRGSMVWDIATHSLDVYALKRPDRSRWASEIAWCQWSLDELRNGDAWEHLKAGVQAYR